MKIVGHKISFFLNTIFKKKIGYKILKALQTFQVVSIKKIYHNHRDPILNQRATLNTLLINIQSLH